jgi:hypothetical protein
MRSVLFVTVLLSAAVQTMVGMAQTIVNDNDPSVVYSLATNITTPTSDWQYGSGNSEDYAGDEHSTNMARPGPAYQGASVSITWTGTSITWYGKMGPNYGEARVALESNSGGTASLIFNAYNPTELSQHANVTMTAPAGMHVLTINLLNATQGSDHWQTIDYFSITGGGAVALSQGSTASWKSLQSMVFNPAVRTCAEGVGYVNVNGWTCYGYLASDLSGGQFWGGEAGATISYTFTGNLIELYGRPDAENGYYTVYVDGGDSGTYDANLGDIDDDEFNAVMMFAAKFPGGGTHTIKLVTTGTNNGYYNASGNGKSGNLLQMDEFVSFVEGGSTPPPPPPPSGCQYEVSPQGPANQPLATFSLSDSRGNSWDAGSILWSSNPDIILYPVVRGNMSQDFVVTQKSPGYTICSSHPGESCALNSNGKLIQGPTGDIFQLLGGTASGSNYILDVTACGYVQRPSPDSGITIGSTPANWYLTNPN